MAQYARKWPGGRNTSAATSATKRTETCHTSQLEMLSIHVSLLPQRAIAARRGNQRLFKAKSEKPRTEWRTVECGTQQIWHVASFSEEEERDVISG
ncbi:hypothetical protein M513_12331 [Trichuris suis]|uniref:Uncharacterized protein n=1 Tax=Trichuris suis TaxID=68888 RepID=A0A085LPA7_9BILA|nr:hypothetical protein M513_12331 [Trichuris suis]